MSRTRFPYFFLKYKLVLLFKISKITGGNQIFEYSKTHNLIGGGVCLDTEGVSGVVKLKNCERTARNQQWDYDVKVRKWKELF